MPLDIDRVSLGGTWWRQVRHRLHPLALPEPRGDGRWQRGDATGAVYLADSEATVWAEWYRALAERAIPPRVWLPCDLWRIEVELEAVADLSDPDRLAGVGLAPPRPERRGWPPYQEVGEALFDDGWPALIAPSGARPEGLVLCVFEPAARAPGLQPADSATVVREPPVPPRGIRT